MKNAQTILKELLQIEPSFASKEKELLQLIEALLASKPEVKIDEHFITTLKNNLEKQAFSMKQASPALSSNLFMTMKRFLYPLAGAATTLAIVTAFAVILSQPKTTSGIQKLNENAFGSFKTSTATSGAAVESAMISARPQSGGGGLGGGDAKMMAPSSIMPVPQAFKYVYKGEPVELPGEKVSVYKRVRQSQNDSRLISLLNDFNFDAIDLEQFRDLKVESLNLEQNKKWGYKIYVSLKENAINIYENWAQWEDPFAGCNNDPACYESKRIKKGDIPEDEKIISIADDFLKEYGIDTGDYGAPVVQRYYENDLRIALEQGRPESEIYYPDALPVIYPTLIDGKPVLDQSGNPFGLNVTVNIRFNRVSAMNMLRPENFESSDYAAVTDWNDILKFIENSAYRFGYFPQEGEKQEVEIINPEIVLMSYYRQNENNRDLSDEYAIPALRFKFATQPQYSFQNYVMIPLVKDMFDEMNQAPIPMPLDGEVRIMK